MRVESVISRGRLRRQVAAIAIASALGIVASGPMAAIVDSGPVSIVVPQTVDGLYINLVTGVSGTPASAVPSWDFNAYAQSNLTFLADTAAANVAAVVVSAGVAAVLTAGSTIGPASTFQITNSVSTSGTAFRTTGTEYVGIRFNNETTGGTPNYGYVQLQTTATTGFPATILRYAYENTGAAITIPATIIFAYDLDNNRLVSFGALTPGTLLTDVALTGLNAAEILLGIDFRPANGLLYAVASTIQNGNIDRVVTINTTTGAVTAVSAAITFATPPGIYFGLDFNPAQDRLREVSDSDANLRIKPSDGAIAGIDADLAYVPGDPNFGINPSVVHIAYSNNVAGAVTTTLFGIDSTTDSLVRIGGVNGVPFPNTGQLTTIGPLGVSANLSGGFDIQQATGIAYAALRIGTVSILHTINLTTGAATAVGPIGTGLRIDGLSVAFAPGTFPPAIASAKSRKLQGAGTFDLLLP